MIRKLMLAGAAAAAVLTAAASAPAPVTQAQAVFENGRYELSWRSSRPGAPVDIYAAARPDAPPAERRLVVDDDTDGTASLADPLGEGVRPYFYVQADGAREGVWTASRLIALEGASNFRDLGGYPAAGGKQVKWGQVYRANSLANLTPADYRKVGALGVRVVCDLRTDQERASAPTQWIGTAPVFVTSPKTTLNANMSDLFGAGPMTAASVRQAFIGFYGRMHMDYAEEYRTLFQRLLNEETPLLLHCSAGKDRTGVGSALVLSALGTPRDVVVADYAASETYLARDSHAALDPDDPNAAMFARLPPEVIAVLMRTEPAYIEATFAAIERDYGSVEGYLDKVLGVGPQDVARLRARLTH